MERMHTIAQLEIVMLELAYAGADYFDRGQSGEPDLADGQLRKLIFKLDAVSQAVQAAIAILETPTFIMAIGDVSRHSDKAADGKLTQERRASRQSRAPPRQ